MAVVSALTEVMLAALMAMVSLPLEPNLALRLTGKTAKMLQLFAVMALSLMVTVILRLTGTVALYLNLMMVLRLSVLVVMASLLTVVEMVEVRCPAK